MSVRWGYSPKVEKFIPLGDFPADKYLIIAKRVIENLGWKLSHLSESGIIAYTNISFQSYSEEVSIRIDSNFAIFKSECLGIQLLFNDYGKNELNLDRFFDEFEYVQFHLKDVWEAELVAYHAYIAVQDDGYFEEAPLAVKDKIKNVFYLFYPQRGYLVTPILININILYWLICMVLMSIKAGYLKGQHVPAEDWGMLAKELWLQFGANSRDLVLKGEAWRLLTHQFVHFNFSHLFFNMYALAYVGLMVENRLGSAKTLMIYLLSGICGGLISVINYKIGFMGGASGAVTGLFGAFLALLVSRSFEKNAAKAMIISTVIVESLILINGLLGRNVDNAAHAGGLVSGFIIAYLLYNPVILRVKNSIHLRAGISFLLVFALAMGVYSYAPRYDIEGYVSLRAQFLANESHFSKVYYITSDLSKEEKMRIVKEDGLGVWKKNLALVKQMEKMVLIDNHKSDLAFRSKIAHMGYGICELMYQDYKADSKAHRKEIREKLHEMEVFKSKFLTGENTD